MICGEPRGPRARQDALITRLYINQPVRGVSLKRGHYLLIAGNFVSFPPLQSGSIPRNIDEKISPVGTRGHKGLTARRLGPSRRDQAPPVRCHPASLTTCNKYFRQIFWTPSCLDQALFCSCLSSWNASFGFYCTGRFNFS